MHHYPKNRHRLPQDPLMESAKGWNKTFLYVKSPEGGDDTLRLPPFIMAPPTSMTNWKSYPSRYSEEVTLVERRLKTLKKQGLTGDDLAATFISRRVSPLQKRAHKMHQMSGHRDITRHSTFELTNTQVCHRVHAISKSLLSEEWDFGVDPYSRGNPPPEHFARQDIERCAIGPLELDRTEDDPEEYDADHCLPSFREKTRGRAEPAAGDAVPLATAMPAAPASGSMPVSRPSSSSAPTSLPPPARPRMRTKRPAERSTRGGRGRSKAPRPTIQGAALELDDGDDSTSAARPPSPPPFEPVPLASQTAPPSVSDFIQQVASAAAVAGEGGMSVLTLQQWTFRTRPTQLHRHRPRHP